MVWVGAIGPSASTKARISSLALWVVRRCDEMIEPPLRWLPTAVASSTGAEVAQAVDVTVMLTVAGAEVTEPLFTVKVNESGPV